MGRGEHQVNIEYQTVKRKMLLDLRKIIFSGLDEISKIETIETFGGKHELRCIKNVFCLNGKEC